MPALSWVTCSAALLIPEHDAKMKSPPGAPVGIIGTTAADFARVLGVLFLAKPRGPRGGIQGSNRP